MKIPHRDGGTSLTLKTTNMKNIEKGIYNINVINKCLVDGES
jgi:hypothetical protein